MMIDKMPQAVKSFGDLLPTQGSEKSTSDGTLGQTFKNIFEMAEQNLKNADQTVLKANTGDSVNLHELMLAMEKADISLRLMVQVRNKAVDAYQEIMRMQV